MPDFNSILQGANSGLSSGLSQVNTYASALNGQAQSAQSTVSNISQTASGYIDTLDSVLSNVGLGGYVQGTVGAVLANGFNLSCWGASLTPQLAQERLKKYYIPYFTKIFAEFSTSQNSDSKRAVFNEILKQVYAMENYYSVIKIKQANWSSCAKKAINEVYKPFFKQMKTQVDSILADYVTQGATQEMRLMKPVSYTIIKEYSGQSKDYKAQNIKDSQTVDYPVITKSPLTGGVTPVSNTVVPDPYLTSVVSPHVLDEHDDEPDPKNEESKPSGISPLQIGLALFGLSRL